MCLIGEAGENNFHGSCPRRLLLRITAWLYIFNSRSVGTGTRLMFPTINARLYWPPAPLPRPVPTGKRSFGIFGARPELLTTSEEFSSPVPLPFPTNSIPRAIATADGYWPVGIRPRTLLRSFARDSLFVSFFALELSADSDTTEIELLCEFAT